jgi:ABC-type transport system involved in multi-copper enzyme maturation permease subunit
MFRTILRRELQETLSSSTLIFAVVVLTILVLLSAYIQARYYRRMVEDYTLRQNIHQVENSGRAIVLIRPLPPLLPFFNGVYDSLPDEFRLQSDSVITNPLSGDLTPLDWLFPKIDLSFIIGVLMTLLTILLAHDTIVVDREHGTLKLILSGPVQRRVVLAAKLTGVILLMTIILVYVVLLYTTVVKVFSGGTVDLSVANLSALAVSSLVALLVFVAIAALGVAISASSRRSFVSLSLCASIWMVAVLVWPSLGPYIASSFKTVSTLEAAQRDIALKERELIQAELAEQRKTAADLKAQNVGVESAWRQYLELRRRWMERRNVEIGRLVEERKRQIRDQHFFARLILAFSPYVAFKEALGSLCGTGLESYDEFHAAVERYGQQEFLPASFDLLSRQKPWLNAAKPDDRVLLRPLQAPSPTFSERLAAAAWPLGVLIAEIIILLTVGVIGFERYDVRRSHASPGKVSLRS